MHDLVTFMVIIASCRPPCGDGEKCVAKRTFFGRHYYKCECDGTTKGKCGRGCKDPGRFKGQFCNNNSMLSRCYKATNDDA